MLEKIKDLLFTLFFALGFILIVVGAIVGLCGIAYVVPSALLTLAGGSILFIQILR
jgi:hypothetical protein